VTSERDAPNGTARPTPNDVAEILRERIGAGELKAGDTMPTQANLVAEFGVQRDVIRQALALLHQEGLLGEATRGDPVRIAAQLSRGEAPDGTPQETLVALGPKITEAFEATEVRIDALCLTAESLSAALGEQRRLVRRTAPSKVTVRVLLPNRDIDLAFPRLVSNPDESDLVHQRWLMQRNAHGSVLRDHLHGLGSAHGVEVTARFRALPFTPPVKLYLLNGSAALFAYYRVKQREEEIGKASVMMYDAIGGESPLFSFGYRSQRDKSFVAQSQAWFDALWETIATELTLD
jgi:DNA-binding transcriptional regulator YhcF (GntR family)